MNYKRITDLPGVRIAREAMVVGDVTIGEDSCVLFYSTVRGDEGTITIGRETNIQESCTIHASIEGDVVIGDNVTIGHQAVVHGCTVGDRTLIGMAATILDGAEIGCDCIVGAGTCHKQHPGADGSLVLGSPAKVVRQLTEAEKKEIYRNSREYVKVAHEMQEQGLAPVTVAISISCVALISNIIRNTLRDFMWKCRWNIRLRKNVRISSG